MSDTIKWAGSKMSLIAQIEPHLPPSFTNYHEPFVGSGALFFHLHSTKPAKSAVLSDLNLELVNFWQVVQDDVEGLILALEEHARSHSAQYFAKVRSQHPSPENQLSLFPPSSPLERAARLKYLVSSCFNGLYRENSKGEFNTSFGWYKKPVICNAEKLRLASVALQGVEILHQDFSAVLGVAQSGDFIYFDPPYAPVSDTSDFTSYTQAGFSSHRQVNLRDVAQELVDRGCFVLISNSDCEFTRSLYENFNLHVIQASRSINSDGEKRGKVPELLVQGGYTTANLATDADEPAELVW
jgi:DNA adenine methylase